MIPVPIALFVYARPDHLRRTLACLRENHVPLIYAFCDGPKTPDKDHLVNEARSLLRGIDWCEVILCERDDNWGLGHSILAGVTDVLNHHGACLVFEDDLICVTGAYNYLSAALNHYRDDSRVMSVTGWTHPRVTPMDMGDQPYFDGRAESLVWGTWARSWAGMNDHTAKEMMLACEAKGIGRNTYGADLPGMAESELSSNIWAVRFLYHHILNRGLCLRPPWSLVEHIGFDALATNASGPGQYANPPLRPCPPVPSKWPEPIEHHDIAALWRDMCPLVQPSPAMPPEAMAKRVKRRLRRIAVDFTGSTRLKTISLRQLLDLWVPPIAYLGYRTLRRRLHPDRVKDSADADVPRLDLVGNYSSWSDAQADSVGYDSTVILRKTAASLGKVKRGEAIYERDSVLFDEVQYAWPSLAGLMWVAACSNGDLNVLDVGGSLGSTYFQNRAFLNRPKVVQWNIVEQSSQVAIGRSEFQDARLRFFPSIDACLTETQPNVILLSGVLQYLEHPYDLLDTLQATPCQFLVLDQTPFWTGSADRLCVQNVPAEIYPASYPSWIFSTHRFRAILSLHWDVVAEFEALDRLTGPVPIRSSGLIAKRWP
ncbi:MAG: methyltransferase, TIGR04325 family [Chromatiaceae bacterium]